MLRLRDDQWDRIREHFPEEHIPESRPGRKPVPARAILEAVLWILNTGAQWQMLAAMDAAATDSLGIVRHELSGLCATRIHHHAAQAILR